MSLRSIEPTPGAELIRVRRGHVLTPIYANENLRSFPEEEDSLDED